MRIRGHLQLVFLVCSAALVGCAGPRHDGMIPLEIIAQPNGASYELILEASDEPPPDEIAVRTRMPDGTMVDGLYVEPYTGDPTTVPSRVPRYIERVDGRWKMRLRYAHFDERSLGRVDRKPFQVHVAVFAEHISRDRPPIIQLIDGEGPPPF